MAFPLAIGPAQASPVDTAESGMLSDGFAALGRGDLDAARGIFTRLQRNQAGLSGTYIGLAEIALRDGKPAEAESRLQQGLFAAPGTPALYRALGRVYATQSKPDLVIAMFDKAGADAASNRLELADLLNQRLGLASRALPIYDQAISLAPSNSAAHYGKGLALLRTTAAGQPPPQAAWTELEMAQRLDPDGVLPLYAMAQAKIGLNDPIAASALLDKVIALKPDFAQARLARGTLLLDAGHYKEATAEFRTVVAADPRTPNALAGLGMAQQAGGDFQGAEASYRQALTIDPKQPVILNNLASLMTGRAEKLDEALDYARQAVALVPTNPEFLDTLGSVNARRGDPAAAEVAFKQSIERRPSAETLTRLGRLQADTGRKANASETFRRALKLRPGFAPAVEALQRLG